jgi:tetratricopeptide (TPR) repeat protein
MADKNQEQTDLEINDQDAHNSPGDAGSLDATQEVRLEKASDKSFDETQVVNGGFDKTQVTSVKRDETSKIEAGPDVIPQNGQSPSEATGAETDTGNTTPPPPVPPDANTSGEQNSKKQPKWWLYVGIGLVILLLIAGISAVTGYASGISKRKGAESTQVAQQLDEQYQLGLQDMAQGKYEQARQRFEFILENDPNYPEVTDKLAEVLLQLNTTATPTLVPTSTLTPTPDLRSEEELFSQAQDYILNEDWQNALDTSLQLRKLDPAYQDVAVDGMIFLSLRNLGVRKILNADLEGGIYDLTLAKKYSPLDVEAEALNNWATLYITGASFWELDWGQAAYYFGQVAPHAPNLRDGTGLTAIERYLTALVKYGEFLANQKKWCEAQKQFEAYLAMSNNAEVEQALAVARNKCEKTQNKDK